jgi:hypothetical protein
LKKGSDTRTKKASNKRRYNNGRLGYDVKLSYDLVNANGANDPDINRRGHDDG